MDKLTIRITFVALLLVSCVVHAHKASVQFVIPADNAAMLNFARAARHALLQVEPALQVEIGTSVKTVNADTLLVPIGDELMATIHATGDDTRSILFFYASSTAYHRLPPHRGETALFRDQPLQRQLELAALLLPNARRALVLYRDNRPEIHSARGYSQQGVSYRDVGADSNWITKVAQWIQHYDVLISIDDRKLYNRESIRSILLTTYRQGKVLIGPDRGFVNAGSLASVYSTPEQYLQQLQRMVQAWLHNHALPAAEFPRDYQLAVNRQVADSLGLRLPDDSALLQQLRQRLQPLEVP
jgi:ABC-type uncharacterized transport system substrate-binding protein